MWPYAGVAGSPMMMTQDDTINPSPQTVEIPIELLVSIQKAQEDHDRRLAAVEHDLKALQARNP